MPCWTKVEIKLGLSWPAQHVIAAIAKLQGWRQTPQGWVHNDGTRLAVVEGKATLVGTTPQKHVKPIATEIVRQQAAKYGWRVTQTPYGLRLQK